MSALNAAGSSLQSTLSASQQSSVPEDLSARDGLASSSPQVIRDTQSSIRSELDGSRQATPPTPSFYSKCCKFLSCIVCCPIFTVIIIPVACILAPLAVIYDCLRCRCLKPSPPNRILQGNATIQAFVVRLGRHLSHLNGTQTLDLLRQLRTSYNNFGVSSMFTRDAQDYNQGFLPSLSQIILMEIVTNPDIRIENEVGSSYLERVTALRTRYESLSDADKAEFNNREMPPSEAPLTLRTELNALSQDLRLNDFTFKHKMRSTIMACLTLEDVSTS